MNRARWYSSSTALVNGEIYIQGGNGGGDRPEVRDRNGNFRLLSNANTSVARRQPFRAISSLRTAGYSATTPTATCITSIPTGTGQITTAGQFPSSYAGWTSSAAMYRPGKILQMGGNSNGSVMIDITDRSPWSHRSAADVLQAAVGVGHRARGRPGARDRWQSAGQHAQWCQQHRLRSGIRHRELDRRPERLARAPVSLRRAAAAGRAAC